MKPVTYKDLSVRIELIREKVYEKGPVLKEPEDVFGFVKEIAFKDREHFLVILLNTKNEVLGIETVSIGSLNSAIVQPREIFKAAILANSASVILVHNHPSGDLEPSKEDLKSTKKLQEAGNLLNIPVIDHLIINSREYLSFKNKNLI